MPTLLEINVDTLFEQHSVSEIDQIHKKLQNDVEQKKEELRTMVGYISQTHTVITIFPFSFQ